ADQGVFRQWAVETIPRHEELWITEALERTNAKDDLLSGSLGGFNLTIKLSRVEYSRRQIETIPVGAEANDLKGIGEQFLEGRSWIQAKSINLWGTEADAQ